MKREPVRWLWIVVVALGALLGVGGIGDVLPDRVLWWMGAAYLVLTAVLGEVTRSKVTPVADPRDENGAPLIRADKRLMR